MKDVNRIYLKFEWLKGLKLSMPYSKIISISIAILIFSCSVWVIGNTAFPYVTYFASKK